MTKKIAAILFAALLLVVSCSALADETFNLKLGHNLAEDHAVHISLTAFAADVAEKSAGTINIQIFPNGTLGSESDMISQVQFGMLDMAKVSASTLGNYNKLYNAYSVPYVFDNQEHYYSVMDGEIANELYMATEGDGFIGLTWLDSGSRSFYITDAAYKKANFAEADLTGLKIRMQNNAMMVRMIELLGGTGVTGIGANEVYSSIQTGVVDGAENPLSGIDGNALYEVSEYLTLDNHTYNIPVLVMSERTWNKANDATKALLKETWMECVNEFFIPQLETYEAGLLEKFAATGVTIIETLPDYEKWVEACAPVWAKYGAGMEDLIAKAQSYLE